jgi:hypothetical protein
MSEGARARRREGILSSLLRTNWTKWSSCEPNSVQIVLNSVGRGAEADAAETPAIPSGSQQRRQRSERSPPAGPNARRQTAYSPPATSTPKRTAPNVKKPGLPPRAAPPRTRSPLRRSRQRVEFHRLHGYRPRPQPPRPPEGGIRPRTVAPASSTSADLAVRLARGVDRRLNVRTL